MDLRKIKKLIDLLEESNLAEIEIKEGEESVRLARVPKGGGYMQASAPMVQHVAAPAPAAVPAQVMPMQSPRTTAARPRRSRRSSAWVRRSRPARPWASSRR